MNDKDFAEWVSAHIAATGAEPKRMAELLWANRPSIVEYWKASYAELCECTQRLFETGRVPQFPSEHPNAIFRELKAIRAERDKKNNSDTFAKRYYANGHVEKCDCPSCNGGEILPSYEAATGRLRDYIARHGSLAGGIGLPVPKE